MDLFCNWEEWSKIIGIWILECFISSHLTCCHVDSCTHITYFSKFQEPTWVRGAEMYKELGKNLHFHDIWVNCSYCHVTVMSHSQSKQQFHTVVVWVNILTFSPSPPLSPPSPSPPSSHNLLVVSRRYRKCRRGGGGAWVLGCVCHLFLFLFLLSRRCFVCRQTGQRHSACMYVC